MKVKDVTRRREKTKLFLLINSSLQIYTFKDNKFTNLRKH